MLNEFRHRARSMSCIRGHFVFGLHGELNDTEPVYLTFLRDPLDRLLSLHHYLANGPVGSKFQQDAASMSFEEFVVSSRKDWAFLDNDMTRRLAGYPEGKPCDNEAYRLALKNLQVFPLIGLTEKFEDTLLRWKEMFGWLTTNYTLTFDQPNRRRRIDLDLDVIEKVYGKQHYDWNLYQYAQGRDWAGWKT